MFSSSNLHDYRTCQMKWAITVELNIAPCSVQLNSVYLATIHYEIQHKKKLLHGKGARKKTRGL